MRTTSEAPVAEPQPVKRAPRGRESAADAAMPRSGAAVEIERLAHSFGDLEVIARLGLRLGPGEVRGIVGPSGCGKSTLLELVSGLRRPSAGSIAVQGPEDPRDRLASCAYMP